MIHILKGPVHSGKTTLLKKTILLLRKNHLRVDGYLSESTWKNKKFIGYDLLDLKDDRSHPFIRKRGREEWQRIGPFYFLPETLDIAKKIIHRCKEADLCVVDEVGPLELEGQGVWPALKDVLMTPGQNTLLVARESILHNLREKIQTDNVVMYDIGLHEKPARLAESLFLEVEKQRKQRQI